MIRFVNSPAFFLFAVVVVGTIFLSAGAHAEDTTREVDPPEYRVLDSLEIDLGSRSIIYNRVETPVLKPQPTPAGGPSAPVAEYVPTAEELEEMRQWEALSQVSLFLTCTVYDGRWSEVSFRQGNSDVVFWSTVNFRYLSHLFDLQTEDTYYLLFMGIGDSTKEEFTQKHKEFLRNSSPDLVTSGLSTPLAPGSMAPASSWHITSKRAVPAEVLRTIEDLHSYFDENREVLIAQHAEREAARIAHEQWLKNNPPQPKDTIIQFFPIQSDHSPTEARTFESALPATSTQ